MSDVSAKTRVLFVDDEPLVLQGLQRMLRPMRTEWEIAFVESGACALETMAVTPFQVIVSDMRMPGMNGPQLLSEIQQLYPYTVRLILSGHADKDLIMKCVGTAHQFLAKPCEPDALKVAIARASAFDNSVKCEKIRTLVARMESLPSIPALLSDIAEKLEDEECSLDEVGELISRDIAITAKLLKLVNSAFFGLRRQISDPSDAVTYLGLETIRSLVLAVHAFSTFDGHGTGPVSLEGLWSHSLEVANTAKRISEAADGQKTAVEESFIAGMLHDIGKLAIGANLPEEYARVTEFAVAQKMPLHAAEEKMLGANHAEIGGFLLSLWGLPARVVDAIAVHHEPGQSSQKGFSPVVAVHVADAFSRGEHSHLLDTEFLKNAGVLECLDDWRHLRK